MSPVIPTLFLPLWGGTHGTARILRAIIHFGVFLVRFPALGSCSGQLTVRLF
jgi:hypothetical protein